MTVVISHIHNWKPYNFIDWFREGETTDTLKKRYVTIYKYNAGTKIWFNKNTVVKDIKCENNTVSFLANTSIENSRVVLHLQLSG